jgi:hypothetical protein
MRSWDGDDRGRAAILRFSGKNEILGAKNYQDSRRFSAKVRSGAHGVGIVFGIFWQNLNESLKCLVSFRVSG